MCQKPCACCNCPSHHLASHHDTIQSRDSDIDRFRVDERELYSPVSLAEECSGVEAPAAALRATCLSSDQRSGSYQPRATPWVHRRRFSEALKARIISYPQPCSRSLRTFRPKRRGNRNGITHGRLLSIALRDCEAGLQPAILNSRKPRALPWADMNQAVGLFLRLKVCFIRAPGISRQG